MLERLLIFYALGAAYWLLSLALARFSHPRLDHLGTFVRTLVAESLVWYGLVWVWSGVYRPIDLALVVFVPLGIAVVLAFLRRSTDPAAGSWLLTGTYVAREIRLRWAAAIESGSPRRLLAVFVAIALLPAAVIVVVLVSGLLALGGPDAGDYQAALTLAGAVAMITFISGSAWFIPFLRHPALSDAGRLRLLCAAVSRAAVPAVLLGIGGQTWPIGQSLTLPWNIVISGWLAVVLCWVVVALVLPTVLGSQRRTEFHQQLLEWQLRFSSRARAEFAEIAAGTSRSDSSGLGETVSRRLDEQTGAMLYPGEVISAAYHVWGEPMPTARPTYEKDDDQFALSARAGRLMMRRLVKLLLQPVENWHYRSGWSAMISEYRDLITLTELEFRLIVLETRRVFRSTMPVAPKGLRWVERLANWIAKRLLRIARRLIDGRVQALAGWLGGIEYLPETDPRWSHILWLRATEDSLITIETQLKTEDELDSKTVASGAAEAFDKDAARAKVAVGEVRADKRLGAKIALLFTTTVPLMFISPFLKALLPILR